MSRAEDTLTAEGERMSPWPAQIAIIGAGTMGLGIAEQFALAGRRVRLTDATADLARLAKQKLLARVAGHVAAGLLPEEAIARLDAVEALDDIPATVAGAEFILEAVPEDRAAKAAVLALCAEHAPREAVIASNTSSFPIDGLAAFVSEPTRFLGTHWFNPPEWTPGVEVIAHAGTAPDVVARVLAFLSEVGKLPVLVGNGPGFVANRIQNALFLEAVRCVEEGLASPQEVDAIVRSTFGFRLPFFGPFQIADMAGLDLRPVPDRRYGRARYLCAGARDATARVGRALLRPRHAPRATGAGAGRDEGRRGLRRLHRRAARPIAPGSRPLLCRTGGVPPAGVGNDPRRGYAARRADVTR